MLTHGYYLFAKPSTGEYHTLSFYGTKFALYSKGVWVIDSDSDVSAYLRYITGKNEWDVAEISVAGGINTMRTARNITKRMNQGMGYYYLNHLRNVSGNDNCNTALLETIAVSQRKVTKTLNKQNIISEKRSK